MEKHNSVDLIKSARNQIKRNYWMTDKIQLNLYCKYDAHNYKDYFDEFLCNRYKASIPAIIDGRERKIGVKRARGMIVVTFFFHSRMTFLLRKKFMREFGKKRFREEYPTTGKNYIPPSLMKPVMRRYRAAEVRDIGFRLVNKEIRKIESIFTESIREKTGLIVTEHKLQKSIEEIEVCFDVILPPGVDLAADESFRKIVERSNNIGINSVGSGPVGNKTLTIKHDDGSVYVIYLKSFGDLGSTHRFERRLDKDFIRQTRGSNTLPSDKEFEELCTIFADEARTFLLLLLSDPDGSIWMDRIQIIKNFIDQNYAPRDATVVFERLRSKGCLHTGTQRGTLSANAIKKTRQLANKGAFLKKRRKGIYEVDDAWINKQIGWAASRSWWEILEG